MDITDRVDVRRMGFLLLGLDSLIASIAVSPIVGRRLWLPYALAFGICDGLGSMVGIIFKVNVGGALADGLEVATPVVLGLYLLAIAFVGTRLQQRDTAGQSSAGTGTGTDTGFNTGRWATWPVWILPIALAADNISYHLLSDSSVGSVLGQSFGVDALSSAVLALIGLLVGAAVARGIPALKRAAVSLPVAGTALILAGGLITAID